MDLENLYAKLSVPLQNWTIGLEGWRLKRKRYNPQFRACLEEYNRRTMWNPEQIAEFRDRRVAEFVSHAAQTVPYYRDLFSRLGIDEGDIKGLEDLKALPVLTRREVQENPQRFFSESVLPSASMTCHTSGSTGAGLRFLVTFDAHREQWAVWWRYRGWHGLNLDTPCLYFGGRSVVALKQKRPPFWRYNRSGHQILFSDYHLGPETAPFYLEEMQRSKASWIHGYPSLIALLGAYAVQFGVRLNIRWVTLGAESLLPLQAKIIEEAFGVKPIEHYGMAEGIANISMCPAGKLHVDEDFAAVEFLPLGSDEYSVIGTNFSNPAFPLIRYEVGDVVTLGGGPCNCGRPGRLVNRIDGRKEDYVITKSGARLGRLDHIFKDLVNVREAQIRQSRIGHMEIQIIKGPCYNERDELALRRETLKRVGDEVDFEIKYVNDLPRTANGKLRFVVSSVASGTLTSAIPSAIP